MSEKKYKVEIELIDTGTQTCGFKMLKFDEEMPAFLMVGAMKVFLHVTLDAFIEEAGDIKTVEDMSKIKMKDIAHHYSDGDAQYFQEKIFES